MKNQLDELFSTQMTRKEFMQHVGGGMLVLFGISGFLKALIQPKTQSHSMGYGSSAYGGIKK